MPLANAPRDQIIPFHEILDTNNSPSFPSPPSLPMCINLKVKRYNSWAATYFYLMPKRSQAILQILNPTPLGFV
ncbi:hypothetical protein BV372_28275 [Nostoc sp. T09]|nr:hypothetical protein BV372_28275 [Nostoc sp. T09]